MLAATERFLCITKPFFHRKYVTKSRVVHVSLFLPLISTVPPITLLSVAGFQQMNLNNFGVIIYSHVFDATIFFLIIAISGALAWSLKVGRASMNSGISAQKQHMRLSKTAKNEEILDGLMKGKVRLVLILSTMMAVFLVSLLPFAIGRLLYDTGVLSSWSPTNQYIMLCACHVFYKMSSLFNPLLTLTSKDDYRKFIKIHLRKMIGH